MPVVDQPEGAYFPEISGEVRPARHLARGPSQISKPIAPAENRAVRSFASCRVAISGAAPNGQSMRLIGGFDQFDHRYRGRPIFFSIAA
jgi:hypothetical protein